MIILSNNASGELTLRIYSSNIEFFNQDDLQFFMPAASSNTKLPSNK